MIKNSLGNNFGIKYLLSLGSNLKGLNRNDEALEYLKRAQQLKNDDKNDDKELFANIFNVIGIIYSQKKEYPLSEIYHNKSIAIKEEIYQKDNVSLLMSIQNRTHILFHQNKYE